MVVRVGILTVSDRSFRGERVDASGPALESVISEQGWNIVLNSIVPDEVEIIRRILIDWADGGGIDLILTTGGTGFGPRDVTPEATRLVVERLAPGITEAIRAQSLPITPHAMLSRAVAGIRNRSLIINLPGSPKGAVESLNVVLPVIPHAVELMGGEPGSETHHNLKTQR